METKCDYEGCYWYNDDFPHNCAIGRTEGGKCGDYEPLDYDEWENSEFV